MKTTKFREHQESVPSEEYFNAIGNRFHLIPKYVDKGDR